MPNPKRYLIAGCGYVGSQLAAVLAPTGATVYALRRSKVDSFPELGVHWLAADMVHGDLALLPGDLDAVFYTAAPGGGGEEAYKDCYLHGLGRMLGHLKRHGRAGCRLILTSSTSVYGQASGEEVDEASPTEPTAATARIILAGEALLGPGDISVRLAGIYGPGRTSMIEGIRSGSLTFNPQTSAYTNRIHRDDAARILAHVAALPVAERLYIGVDALSATRYEVAAWIAAQLGTQLPLTSEAESSSTMRGHKRCSNRRLAASGYRYLYPTYKEGYGALLKASSGPY